MNASKIIPFDKNRVDVNRPARLAAQSREGVVIHRKEFHHWMKPNRNIGAHHTNVSDKFSMMQERIGRIKIAFEHGRDAEVVTQSARIAVIADQLCLPRTAKLAAEIGESQMAHQRAKAERLIAKLESIISALDQDFQRDAK